MRVMKEKLINEQKSIKKMISTPKGLKLTKFL